MGIEFGKNARKVITRGELTCSFQYVNHEEAACFWPTFKRGANVGCYIIALSSAWKYGDESKAGIERLVKAAATAAQVMGFDQNSKNVVGRIGAFMQDMLVELLTMKPEPLEFTPKLDLDDLSIRGNSIDIVGTVH